eukprot:5450400-Prymnesium_polylepis.1
MVARARASATRCVPAKRIREALPALTLVLRVLIGRAARRVADCPRRADHLSCGLFVAKLVVASAAVSGKFPRAEQLLVPHVEAVHAAAFARRESVRAGRCGASCPLPWNELELRPRTWDCSAARCPRWAPFRASTWRTTARPYSRASHRWVSASPRRRSPGNRPWR